MKRIAAALIFISLTFFFVVAIGGCGSKSTKVPDSQGSAAAHKRLTPGILPKPDHIVIVVEENKSYDQIIDNKKAPYINKLIRSGASFQKFYAITHPSEPNYLALFSGSIQDLTDDSCPHQYTTENLSSILAKAGYSFTTYSQSLPKTGYKGCRHGAYVRKHNPATNWQGSNVGSNENLPFRDFPQNYNKLPTVAFVIPDLDHDMHDGSISAGDTWLRANLKHYARWAQNNNSLLVVTWDEDDDSQQNQIATIIVGAHVRPGTYDTPINHFNLLRTIEAMYGLPFLAKSAQAIPITSPWRGK